MKICIVVLGYSLAHWSKFLSQISIRLIIKYYGSITRIFHLDWGVVSLTDDLFIHWNIYLFLLPVFCISADFSMFYIHTNLSVLKKWALCSSFLRVGYLQKYLELVCKGDLSILPYSFIHSFIYIIWTCGYLFCILHYNPILLYFATLSVLSLAIWRFCSWFLYSLT